jgi:hypothetical protein
LMTMQNSLVGSGSQNEMNVSAVVLYSAETPGSAPKLPWLVMRGTYVGAESKMEASLGPLLSNPGCWPRFEPLLGTRKKLKFDRCSRLVSRNLKPEDWRSILVHFLSKSPNRQSTLQIDAWGGAISTYPLESSAFIHRDTKFNLGLTVWWQSEQEKERSKSFTSSWTNLMDPFWNGGIYQNFPSADAPDYERNYWGPALPALAAVKQKYDPRRLFDFSQAIQPGSLNCVKWPPKVVRTLRQPVEVSV